ncbi:hypothetical protein, partial [Bartonella sp. OT172YNZD]|uniref:hypothetical protein n=1 Tax=Bartonella sp. OT172YNZD TaxID=3243572 RepID=UPI0035D11671
MGSNPIARSIGFCIYSFLRGACSLPAGFVVACQQVLYILPLGFVPIHFFSKSFKGVLKGSLKTLSKGYLKLPLTR